MAYLGQDLVSGQQRYSPSFYSSIPFLKAVKLENLTGHCRSFPTSLLFVWCVTRRYCVETAKLIVRLFHHF